MDALRRAGARSVEREGERIVALFPPPRRVERLLEAVRRGILASTDLSDPDPRWRWLSHEAWAERWRRDVPTRRVTRRIVVTTAGAPEPPHPPEPPGPAGAVDVVIRLHPAMAFGTAEHPTTRSCLAYLDRAFDVAASDAPVEPPASGPRGGRVLDLGSGTGILAIAAVLLGAERALAVEADPVAWAGLRENLVASGVADRVEARALEVRPRDLRRLGRFDLVMANLQAAILLPLLPSLPATLAAQGRVLVSGLIRPERPAAVDAARAGGLALEWETTTDGWWTGVFRQAGDP